MYKEWIKLVKNENSTYIHRDFKFSVVNFVLYCTEHFAQVTLYDIRVSVFHTCVFFLFCFVLYAFN